MLSDWKAVRHSAAVVDSLSSGGILGGIGSVIYHCTDIDMKQEKAMLEASPRRAEGEEGKYRLGLLLCE